MDIVFISKVLIITALFLLTLYLYVKIEWQKSGKKEWKRPLAKKINNILINVFNKDLTDFLVVITVIIWGIPLMYSFIFLVIIVLFEGTLNLIDSKNYWEQILICFGFINLFFAIRIYLDGEKIKKIDKDLLIEIQRKTIVDLERKLSLIEKSKISNEKGE